MRELLADFFVSADGFASGETGGQEWVGSYAGPEMGGLVQKVLSEPQVLVLGRRTYEVLAGFWPKAKVPQAGPMNHLPKIVFSKTLKAPLAWNNSTLVAGELGDEMRALKRQPGPPLRTIGSAGLGRNLIALGLVDRLRLLVFPAILGRTGQEPIFESYDLLRLELLSSKILDGSTLWLEYRPISIA
jgi:dihydrofolate reductase